MGADNTDDDGKDVQEGGAPEKPGQDQKKGIHNEAHMVPTGSGGLQEESNR